MIEILKFEGCHVNDTMILNSFKKSRVIAGGERIGQPEPFHWDKCQDRKTKAMVEDLSFLDELDMTVTHEKFLASLNGTTDM